jgi:hypothetical protein
MDNVLDIINNTYTTNKVLLKLRQKDIPVLNQLYSEGLIEKNQVSRLLKWYKYLNKPSKPRQPDENLKSRIDSVKSLVDRGLAEINPGLERFLNSKYLPQGKNVEKSFGRVSYHVRMLGDKKLEDIDYRPLVERAKELSGKAIMKLGKLNNKGYIEMKPMSFGYKGWEKDFRIMVYDPEQMVKIERMKDFVALEKEDIERLDGLIKEGKIEFDDGYKMSGEKSDVFRSSFYAENTASTNQSNYTSRREMDRGMYIHKNGYERLKAFG